VIHSAEEDRKSHLLDDSANDFIKSFRTVRGRICFPAEEMWKSARLMANSTLTKHPNQAPVAFKQAAMLAREQMNSLAVMTPSIAVLQ
jgi:hypothetical protein